MQELCKEICQIIEKKDDLTFSKVGELIGASKQSMSKLKSGGTIGFRKLLRLSYLLFPTTQKAVMSKWCLRVDSTESIKQAFEYATVTRNIELLGKLIDKHKDDESLREYVAVYSILYDYMTDTISGLQLIEQLKTIGHIQGIPLQILVEIMKTYDYYFQKKFQLMLEVAGEVEKKISLLSDTRERFLKECYLHRIAEISAPIYLHLNNLPLARKYASMMIQAEISEKTVSDACYTFGMSYISENAEICLDYLQKSYELSKNVDLAREKEARMNLDFAKVYLNIPLEEDSHPALIEYQRDPQNGFNLQTLKESMYLKERSDFLVLFEAINSESIPKLYDCFEWFLSQANYFFSGLAAKELQKNGESSIMIEKMIQFTIPVKEGTSFEETFISSFSKLYDTNRGCLLPI